MVNLKQQLNTAIIRASQQRAIFYFLGHFSYNRGYCNNQAGPKDCGKCKIIPNWLNYSLRYESRWISRILGRSYSSYKIQTLKYHKFKSMLKSVIVISNVLIYVYYNSCVNYKLIKYQKCKSHQYHYRSSISHMISLARQLINTSKIYPLSTLFIDCKLPFIIYIKKHL